MISEFPVSDIKRLVEDGVIKGSMIRKAEACVRMVELPLNCSHSDTMMGFSYRRPSAGLRVLRMH